MKYKLLASHTNEVCDINCSVLQVIREVQTKAVMAYPSQKGYHQKSKKITSVAKDAEKKELLYAIADSVNYYSLNESTKDVPTQLKIKPPHDPVILLLDIYPKAVELITRQVLALPCLLQHYSLKYGQFSHQ